MKKGLHIGIVGVGSFAPSLIPLFKLHPYVASVRVTDHHSKRMELMRDQFGCDISPSFAALLNDSEVNCIALFTPRHTHGLMSVQALKAGKHVFSAVPMGNSPEECQTIIDLVKNTGLIYMMGETCYYYPCTCWCRDQQKKGAFGKPIYIASQYYHDLVGFDYPRLGIEWQRVAGIPPMLYPTHSFTMALSVMDACVSRISCAGYRDTEDDHVFGEGFNLWDNPFSCEVALAHLSNGGIARVNEFRRVGTRKPSSYISTLIGTRGVYECSLERHLYQHKTHVNEENVAIQDVSDQINPSDVTASKYQSDYREMVANDGFSNASFASCQPRARLPRGFLTAPNGHMATHQFLVDDFCRAVFTGKLPPLNAWFASRVNLPGLIAHESALHGGIQMEVPDLGDAPADWEFISYEDIK